MLTKFTLFSIAFIFVTLSISTIAAANETKSGVTRQLLAKETLPNIPGHTLTAVTVRLGPAEVAPTHVHDAFVYVYLLEGKISSQLGDQTPVEYGAGQSWIELPGTVHTQTKNLSETQVAVLLAVFVGENNTKLTTSGNIGQ